MSQSGISILENYLLKDLCNIVNEYLLPQDKKKIMRFLLNHDFYMNSYCCRQCNDVQTIREPYLCNSCFAKYRHDYNRNLTTIYISGRFFHDDREYYRLYENTDGNANFFAFSPASDWKFQFPEPIEYYIEDRFRIKKITNFKRQI